MQVYVDDIEGEEEGIAESLLDNYTIASMPRPGTSLKNPGTAIAGQGFRPKTQSGRPVTGIVRPATQSAVSQSVEQALRTPRTAMTSRPITAISGRSVRYFNNESRLEIETKLQISADKIYIVPHYIYFSSRSRFVWMMTSLRVNKF